MLQSPYQPVQHRNTALRFIKDKPGMYGLPNFSFLADFECTVCKEPGLFYETDTEFVVDVRHFILKDACLVTCQFPVSEQYSISEILCEGIRLPFDVANDTYTFTFEISGLTGPTRTLYTHTILRENGLTLRIEQNTLSRCTGKYSKETYPALQIQAAHHYMFAMREIAHALSLPEYLSEKHLGYLLILGFETCNTIHTDFPPHWHLIYRWPYFCGSQAPHIYLGDQGEMTSNILYIDGIRGVCREYAPGEWCHFVDMYGADLMAFCITDEGGMCVTKPNGDMYTMLPYQEGQGVVVTRNDVPWGTVQVTVSDSEGKAQVDWRSDYSFHEQISFDPLTGSLQHISRESL